MADIVTIDPATVPTEVRDIIKIGQNYFWRLNTSPVTWHKAPERLLREDFTSELFDAIPAFASLEEADLYKTRLAWLRGMEKRKAETEAAREEEVHLRNIRK